MARIKFKPADMARDLDYDWIDLIEFMNTPSITLQSTS